MGNQFGKNAVFRRAEECAMDAHATKDDQREYPAGWVEPERNCSGTHEEHFDDLDGDDDRSLAQAIG